jgi:NAD(P)-dependent dehydrogenase (short-subunit alcohol dehydrogenase family)
MSVPPIQKGKLLMPATKKVIVITGATRGLGRAIVDRFVELGHTVAGCGRSGVDDLSNPYGKPHSFHAVDVADDRSVGRWARAVLEALGPPDLLLNNAGLINSNAPLWKVPVDEVAKVLNVNIGGVVNVIRHFVPAMIDRGSGVIVNFSSGWGRATAPEVAPYCATKWGVEGLTQAFAQELPKGLAAIALNPGIVNTDMLQSCFGRSASKFPDAEEWSRVAAPFLLKLGSRDNGEALTVPIND